MKRFIGRPRSKSGKADLGVLRRQDDIARSAVKKEGAFVVQGGRKLVVHAHAL
jgi:hypothetical protein